jgi:hypothetical protein
MLWATVVMRIRSNDRSSCAVLSMFICEITSSRLRPGGDSLRQEVRESAYGLFAEHRRYSSGLTEDTKRKGCDIGSALAISSCEEANNVETCTVTALDAITAFAVPNPDFSSQSTSVFSGLVAPTGCPVEQITQPTSD